MSTHTHATRTESEIEAEAHPETPQSRSARTRISTRTAPHTFSPHNTDPCPQMFADKWAAEPDDQR
jgi:hypothetical protein